MFKVLVPLFPKVGWIVEVETSQNLLVSLSGLINFLVIINEVFQLLVNVTQLFTKLPLDLAKPKSRARIFFSRTSQGHNALPRPGLEPRSSNSEPSALTTGLLDKACPQYSWPLMLEVAPCTVVWLYGCTSKFFQLDGLLLFCIIMGLCELCYELNFLAHISQSLLVKFAWLHGRKFKVV